MTKHIKYYEVYDRQLDKKLKFSTLKKAKEYLRRKAEENIKLRTNENGYYFIYESIRERRSSYYEYPKSGTEIWGVNPQIEEMKFGYKIKFEKILLRSFDVEEIYEPEVKEIGKPYKPGKREEIRHYKEYAPAFDLIEKRMKYNYETDKYEVGSTRIVHRWDYESNCKYKQGFGEKVVPSHENYFIEFLCAEMEFVFNGDAYLETSGDEERRTL